MNKSINILNNNKNEISDDIFYKAEDFLKTAFELINDTSNEKDNKKALLYILLNDIIKIDINEKIDEFNANDIFESCISIIDDTLDKLQDKLYEKNNLTEIKKILGRKKGEVLKKIKECNTNLSLLKKEYLNKNIENFLGNYSKNTFNFNNVTTIHSNNKEYNYLLGEFFSRYIFNYIRYHSTQNFSIISNFKQESFYNDDKIESFYLNNDPPEFKDKFSEIDINYKYWVIHFFLILQLFSEKTNYNKLFNVNNFRKFIEELRKIPKTDESKKKKKKEGKKKDKKKQSGGDKSFNKLITETVKINKSKKKNKSGKDSTKSGKNTSKSGKNNSQKSNVNKPVIRNIFNEVIKLKVEISSAPNSKYTLEKIYYDKFSSKLIDYMKYYIINSGVFYGINHTDRYSIQCRIPITPKSELLSSITTYQGNMSAKNVTMSSLNSELKKIKYNIFFWLNLYDFAESSNFITKIKEPLILLLFYLYSIKKQLYKYYAETLTSLFNINTVINSNNKSNSNNKLNSKNKSNSTKSNRINHIFINNIVYDKSNKKTIKKNITNTSNTSNTSNKPHIDRDINSEIEELQRKIDIIKNKRTDINNDEKILLLETKIKELIIKKLE
jgi:hypothetical protein